MTITEQAYDRLLNPIRAEVSISVAVRPSDVCSEDVIASGALAYSTVAKEVKAALNLVNTVAQVVEILPI